MPYPVIHIARLTLEAVTPLSISTGSPDNVFDTALVRDANGLPALPASSLAGVLRHLWSQTHDQASADQVFGWQQRDQGQTSRLALSWGALLDGQGRPAEGLLIGDEGKERLADPLYAEALAQIDAPRFRHRVRLGHKGAAADTGKFDRAVLPAGHRFAVELRLWSESLDDPAWTRLLDLLHHPGLRLGGATRAGLGRVRCVALHQAGFDLRQPGQAEAFLKLGRGLADHAGLHAYSPPRTDHPNWLSGSLQLEARGLWRIGQGIKPLREPEKDDKPADLLPVVEERIEWKGDQAKPTPALILLPAASLKGTLAHRLSFHVRRHLGQWRQTATEDDDRRPQAVDALLGSVKDKARGDREADGQAGCLYLDDAYLAVDSVKVAQLMHNAIDRFTGGVRNRVLYQEESLLGGAVEVPIVLDLSRLPEQHHETLRHALRDTLADLCAGRLALGSRTTSGNGHFQGALSGPLAKWLHQDTETQESA